MQQRGGPVRSVPEESDSTSAQINFRKPTRPPPQFDMNLRDLFPDETQDGRAFSSNLGRWQASTQSSMPTLPLSTQPQPYQPSPDVGMTEQQYGSFDSTQPTPPSAFAPMTSHNAPYDVYGFSNANDLDFLMANSSTTGYNGQPGLDLGFDSEHDWADGAQMDLFDGFFFGGLNGGNTVQGV